MGWRYRRRLRLAPGIYLNIGKTGATSISAGVRGAHLTWGRRGTRASVGLPGSGLSYTAYEPYRQAPPAAPRAPATGRVVLVAVVIILALVGIMIAANP